MSADTPEEPRASPRRGPSRRANDLDGAEWTRTSISVWSDLRKTPDEAALKHPAMFPVSLVQRLIRCLTRDTAREILDPFSGSGSTLVAACSLGRRGIGFEISEEYVSLARRRLGALPEDQRDFLLYNTSADRVPELLPEESVDLCVTSPPYWNILSRKRTADYRAVRDYREAEGDLSRVADYETFLERLEGVFAGVYRVLRPGGYCVINVMDLRQKSRLYPLHSDLASRLSDPERGGQFIYDDLIIWDRRADYNNLRPLGYPAVFRVNKVHEFLVLLRKPPGA